jgi:hypothetical protein
MRSGSETADGQDRFGLGKPALRGAGLKKTKDCTLCLATTPGEWKMGSTAIVDNFVTAKAPDFNKIQQSSTGMPQTLQHQSLRFNKNP